MRKLKKQDTTGYFFDNRALARLIIPLVAEQFLAMTMGMVDSLVVSTVSEAAVSGVSLVDQIMILMINIFAALATGGAVVAGQYLGQKRRDKGCRAATQLLYFVLAASLAITLVIYALQNVILHRLFGHIDADVMRHAKTYLLIVTASIPFIAVYNAGAAIFRAMGNARVTMLIVILMNVVNIIGDTALVLGAKLGTAGVAIPTLVGRIMAAVIIVVLLADRQRLLHLEAMPGVRFDRKMIKRILRLGLPNGLENSMFQLGKILVLSLVATFGTSAIAANAIGNVLAIFQILPGIAMSLAMTAVVSRSIGAGDYAQAKYYNRKLLGISYVLIAGAVALIWLLMPLILRAYHLSPATAAQTREIMFFHSIFCVIIWAPSFVLPATFRAAGDVKACMLIAIISMWVFRIGFAYLLGQYWGLGLTGVWLAMIIDWFFRALCFIIRYFQGAWQNKRVI